MKNRQLLKIHGLSAVCSLIMMLASCSSEEIVPNGTGTDADGDKNLTTFVAVGPEQTRTSMDYTGGDAPFYWEEGDKIYVKDDDGAWKVSNAVDAAHAHSASFKFKVSGKFNNSSTYKVFYPGKNGTNDQVTIPATQTQTAPNTTLHFGEAGDCGMADATGGGGVFNFTLDHQAAILVFQPYTANEILKKCYLTKVEVLSDDNITGTYAIAPGTGDLTGAGSSKQIETATVGTGTYVNGFPLTNATSSATADKVYMLIKPGVHTLRVRYWIKSTIDNIEGTVTKDLSSFDYKKNTYYDMAANLNVKDYDGRGYYMWDAKQNYWYQHEWNSAAPWQPTLNSQPANPNYPQNKTADPDRWYNDGSGVFEASLNPLFTTIPNVNEMAWYAMKGEPHWDADELWTTMGHLYKGGMWFLKKDEIASKYSTTIAAMANADPDGTDRRTTSKNTPNYVIIQSSPSASEIGNYFYLPALGDYRDGKLNGLGDKGNYWTSSSDIMYPSGSSYHLDFYSWYVGVGDYYRNYGLRAEPFE